MSNLNDNATGVVDTFFPEIWQPTGTQIGTEWVENSKKGLGMIFWICVINLIISILPTFIGCFKKCCGNEDDRKVEMKQVCVGTSNTLVTFLIGLLGILSLKFNCKELLMAVLIMALVSLVLSAIMLLVTLLGLGCACFGDENGCEGKFALLISAIVVIFWAILAAVLNILLCIYGWPHGFGS